MSGQPKHDGFVMEYMTIHAGEEVYYRTAAKDLGLTESQASAAMIRLYREGKLDKVRGGWFINNRRLSLSESPWDTSNITRAQMTYAKNAIERAWEKAVAEMDTTQFRAFINGANELRIIAKVPFEPFMEESKA